ncbi:LOW QUALITY PROTEIN: protein mono-ADP-ribosyltransferase PARP15 [Bufo bufo]|uniref:LOW QUALITY PROTEIN: protein mono-ADP-ribosyltransferase PARP15 n=1 Tax=Bufo bufo TaxID=8384 RepID=UPI001ABE32E4|nr:LOW QUALITY PROTEIN: protein mono-ADP-ribosyltransferase PARP15 [Bufo bufo]
MGDSRYLYPVALRWDEGPEALKQVKNKLLLHFQKRKLSNGGECEIRDLDCSRGHLLIYFRDEGVRDRVLQKKPQELKLQDGRALLLDLRSPEELDTQSEPPSGAPTAVCKVEEQQRDEPVTVNPGHDEGTRPRSSYVLIENVQDSCSPEKLNLLVGSISDVPDFYVEMIPERCLAVVTFTCDIDVEAFNEKFSNHHITKQYNMRATALEDTSFAACGYPVETCTECIVTAIQQHMESQEGSGSIRYIHLVDSEDRIVQAFIQSLRDEYEEKNMKFTSKQEVKKLKAQKSKNDGGAADKYNRQMVTTREGLKIRIIQGNIQDATSDVIVNSVGKELDLRSGAVSSAIFRKAGARLQDLLNTEKPQSAVTDGCVFITDGCGLPCHFVLHAVVPRWDEGQGSSEQILRKIVNDCLSASEEKRAHSISFPAMGTGILGFPKNTVAAIMYDESLNFSSKGDVQHLKEVTFMLHPSDTETIKAFSTELEKKTKDPTSQKKSEKSHGLFGPVTSRSAGVTEMKIGPVTYQVKTGDITKEDADIIVNSTNNTFNLKSGVSKKILEEAGKDVEDECAQLGAAPSRPSFVVTKGGKLRCRNIIHIAAITNPANLKKKVTEALAESERLQAASVAFPALGTGVGGLSATVVADVMVDAVVDFVSSKSAKSVQTVKVVVFQPPMLDDFRTSLKKKEHKPWFFSWLIHRIFGSASDEMDEEEDKVFELRENIEPAIFHLCAGTKKDVTDASTWLRDLILKKQNQNEITDDWILELGDEDKQEIAALQKTLQVTVHIDLPSTTIKVSGLSRDVLEMTKNIQLMLKKVREKKTKEREAELCSNLVEWRYHDGTNFVLFDRMANLELEKAKSTITQSLKIDVSGVTYTVILELDCMRDPRGKETKIERVPKHGHILELPTSWDSMEKTQLKVVPVAASSQEYGDVHAQFAKTCQMKVVKIERIQNLHLYQNYQIKKQSIDTKNGSAQNERQLFHGTDENTVKSVNSNGFNRGYSGSNVGAVLGNGTYFAVEANYSAHDNYSKPNANGLKYMYLTRVLTGVSCAGQKGCIAPPAKNPANPTDLYDSVTDNPANPQIFVIFNDVQAYPEYLITFSK